MNRSRQALRVSAQRKVQDFDIADQNAPSARSPMALLGELGVVERRASRLETGATIFSVAIEEQRTAASVEIVVVDNFAPRGRANELSRE
jgi:hypothetical protein